jgi:hypothetical protein
MAYSQFLNENPELVQQVGSRMGQQQGMGGAVGTTQAVQPVATQNAAANVAQAANMTTPNTAQPAQQQSFGQQFQKYSQIAQQIAGPSVHSSSGASPSTLRSSAFSVGKDVQSDAPAISRPGPTGGRINKIMEVVGTIFSMGASQAGSNKYDSRNGGNAGYGGNSSNVGT